MHHCFSGLGTAKINLLKSIKRMGFFTQFRLRTPLLILALAALLAACGGPKQPTGGGTFAQTQGQYRVARGDTLTQIARKHGQTVDSLMRTNNLRNPNELRVGQVLTVNGGSMSVSADNAGSDQALPPLAGSGKSIAAPRSIKLVWPAQGSSSRGTQASNTQGVYIAAASGSAINAAAGGKVVYAGDDLRRYGNMIIVSHDANFMTVYAHNQNLLVKEHDQVKQGQKIATMGNTGHDKVSLYFELRYNGKAVDALRYLPR